MNLIATCPHCDTTVDLSCHMVKKEMGELFHLDCWRAFRQEYDAWLETCEEQWASPSNLDHFTREDN